MDVPPMLPPENGPESSTARITPADTRPVSTECTRRAFVQAGSVMGLLALAGGAGCVNPHQAEAPPDIAWPDQIKAPPPPTREPTIVAKPPAGPVGPTTPPPSAPISTPVGVLPRTRWAPAALGRPSNVRPMNGVAFITVHHDGMDKLFYSDSESDSISRLRVIRNSHMNRPSKSGEMWADIGYHYIIDRAGRVWEGRPIAYQGAHVQDCNEHNIGVMCMGNFEKQQPTKAQTDRLDQFVAQLMRQYGVPLRNVRTHREWNPTECPGRNLQVYMARTRNRGGGMALAVAQTHPQLLA